MRSPTFSIDHRYIHVLATGHDARINVCVDNFTLIRDPIYGGLKKRVNSDGWQWITFDAEMWKSHRAYLEFLDLTVPDLADDSSAGAGTKGDLAVSRVLFSDDRKPPEIWGDAPAGVTLFGDSTMDSPEDLATAYVNAAKQAALAWSSTRTGQSPPPRAQLALLNWLIGSELLSIERPAAGDEAMSQVARLFKEYDRMESALPEPAYVPAMVEGNGLDETVFVRGNPRLPGERVPRRFLEALGGLTRAGFESGSGRAELARRMVDPSNPLLARVMVNRVWHHLFGRGIVASPDDFGVLGQRPTHPELLDWLADWYRRDAGYSTKKLIRLLVTSRTYRMSSRPADSKAEERDPNNALWHRMPIRRLEGETIRDSILALSGRLDEKMFGPPVPVHLTPFMDGRGRPARSGPLDGNGRRSIYLEVRRNFPDPMMRAFDTPVPFTTIGRRSISNVPAQSLILMNDPFVIGQARNWGQHWSKDRAQSAEERITRIYEAAFSRPPDAGEMANALKFLQQQEKAYGATAAGESHGEQVWADFCHVIFNVKEFVFVN